MSEIKISLLAQLLGLLDRNIFNKAVKKYHSYRHSKGINTWMHMASMIVMQLSYSLSLRDIINGLLSATGNLNHLGIIKAPSKSSLSYLNKNRSADVFHEYYFQLFSHLEPSLA